MIKIFYNTTTGTIVSKTEAMWDWEHDQPHITVDEDIDIEKYRIDLETLTLIQNPDYVKFNFDHRVQKPI